MASSKDFREHATSNVDFYSLLSLPHNFSPSELNRAWRKTALKYHPDKVNHSQLSEAEKTDAQDKFQLAQIGFELLSDSSLRQLYDSTRNARIQKERERELYGKERKRKVEDLERRESGGFEAFRSGGVAGVKRQREEEDLDRLERELRRLAEDGKRRRLEREEALRKELEREKEEASLGDGTPEADDGLPPQQPTVSELDRTIKVRLPFPPPSQRDVSQQSLQNLFARFGTIESVVLLQPKLAKLSTGKKKQNTVTAMITYTSLVGAHAAVEDFPGLREKLLTANGFKQDDIDWRDVDSVYWAANQQPEVLTELSAGRASNSPTAGVLPSTPVTPARPRQTTTASSFLNSAPSTPLSHTQQPNGAGVRKVPSFASFSSTPKTSTPLNRSTPAGSGSPSLEELTMIRLKNAEKDRLRRELERKDKEEDERTGTPTREGSRTQNSG